MMRVSALIPAYNEETRIAETVHAVRTIPGMSDIIVADDGSADATASRARDAGARVVRLSQNAGKGAALEAAAAELGEFDIVLLLDADLGASAAQGALLLPPVMDGEADMTIATFPVPATKAGFGLVKTLARWGIRTLGGPFECSAPLSGQRALSREALGKLRPFASGYGVELALTVQALRAQMRLVEIPTTMTHAATGRDLAGFIHRGRQFLHVAGALIRLAITRRNRTGHL